MKLNETRILITGARRGIGWAIAQACAKRKTHLVLLSRNPLDSEKQNLLKKQGALSIQCYSVNLSQRDSMDSFLEQANRSSLQVDVLVNNAGLLVSGPFQSSSRTKIREMLEVNVSALIELSHFFLPQMLERKRGLIVNHSSVSAFFCSPLTATYSASKSAVFAFSLALKKELKGTGVDVLSLVTPGVQTQMFHDVQKAFQAQVESNGDTFKIREGLNPDTYAERVVMAMEKGKAVLYSKGKKPKSLLARYCPPGFFEIFSFLKDLCCYK